MKSAALIGFALFIDGIQAAVSVSLMIIAAFPGTVAGGVGGCLAGNVIAGNIGCFVLGLAGGIFGTALDAAAVVTEPLGIVLGFVISICLSVTLGAMVVGLLMFADMFYPKYLLPGGIVEITPGFDLLPGWTALTVLCVLQKAKEKGGMLGAAAAVATAPSAPSMPMQASRAVDGIRRPEPQTNAA